MGNLIFHLYGVSFSTVISIEFGAHVCVYTGMPDDEILRAEMVSQLCMNDRTHSSLLDLVSFQHNVYIQYDIIYHESHCPLFSNDHLCSITDPSRLLKVSDHISCVLKIGLDCSSRSRRIRTLRAVWCRAAVVLRRCCLL